MLKNFFSDFKSEQDKLQLNIRMLDKKVVIIIEKYGYEQGF